MRGRRPLTFHLQTHSLGQSAVPAVAPPTRITPTNTSSAALEPRPTPTPVIGRPCSSWYTHAHALARALARTQRRPPSHRHGSLMAGGDVDGGALTRGGEHRVWRGGVARGSTAAAGLTSSASVCRSVRPASCCGRCGDMRGKGALPHRLLTASGRYNH